MSEQEEKIAKKRAYSLEYRRKNKEKKRLYDKEYRAKNAARLKEAKRRDYLKNKDRYRKKNDQWKVNNPEKYTNSRKGWERANPLKRKAHGKVRYALKTGKLDKQPCAVCGKADKVEAHHNDYAYPLEVQWLCVPHHKAWHKVFLPESGEAFHE